MAEHFLVFKNVSKIYKSGDEKITALDKVSLCINRGEFVAILGMSGSGKSTMMNIIGGLDRPDEGYFMFNGKNILRYDDREMSRYRNSVVGFIFQSFNLDYSLSALENVIMPLIYAGVARSKRIQIAKDALERVGLTNRLDHKPSELSGGQMQRVCIARAIVNSPEIILADEPTGNLDKKSGEMVMDILCQLNQCGYTILMVTHNSLQAESAGRIIEISDGSIIRDVYTK